VIVFSLAEDVFIKGEQKTIWYDIYLNNARNPEKLSEALKQGRLIMVNGTLRVGTWTTNSGNVLLQQSINVENVTFIRSGGSKQQSNDDYNVGPLEEPEHQVFNDQEELPF
jgi:single-stranded DNA-binding protein